MNLADLVPGGVKPTDYWHHKTNDNTCSRCRKLVSDGDGPLMLWSRSGEDMLIYCESCLRRRNHMGNEWSGEPRVIMWSIARNGAVIRHNFYHEAVSQRAIEQAQDFEYGRGFVTWLEYREPAAKANLRTSSGSEICRVTSRRNA